MNPVYPVIIVPGITATYLRDQYVLPPDIAWSVLTKKYENIALHPDDYRYEAMEPARLQPDQIFEIAYEEMINELRYNLRETDDRPVPVYPFGYDWRQPLDAVESQFEAFIDEVIARTKLMKHYYPWFGKNPKVNLVGHSMGGLIIAGYLEKNGSQHKVNKVVTIASPFKGSFEAIIKIATGTANLGISPPSSREREAARITPSLYHLLPTCEGIKVPASMPNDVYDPSMWQQSILDTLQEYIRLHGVSDQDTPSQAKKLFTSLLQTAKSHRQRINNLSLKNAGLSSDDWLCIAGVDSTTRVGVKVDKDDSGVYFDFNSEDRANQWNESVSPDSKMRTGDGTVPLKAALPDFLDLKNIVCLSPDDFGYWELKDKVTVKLAGFHGLIANMNVIHRLIVRHFTGRPDSYKNTWGRALPGIGLDEWKPPFDLFRKE